MLRRSLESTLYAAVAVMDQAISFAHGAFVRRLLQRIQRQIRAQRTRCTPTTPTFVSEQAIGLSAGNLGGIRAHSGFAPGPGHQAGGAIGPLSGRRLRWSADRVSFLLKQGIFAFWACALSAKIVPNDLIH